MIFPAHARSPAPSQGPSDLYFLTVGGSSYIDADFPSFDAPKFSAEYVGKLLMNAGARHGIILTDGAGDNKSISREDFYSALFELKQRIRMDGSKSPRVIIYVIGHGVADTAANFLFMIPGNLNIRNQPISQNNVFRLAKRSIFSVDILTSMMSFRRDERFEHLDDDLVSDRMSDADGFTRLIEQSQLEANYAAHLDRKAASYGSAPFDNAPIPFLVLFDNCNDGFVTDLVASNPLLNLMVQTQNQASLEFGRAIYAIQPGQIARPRLLPSHLASDEYKYDRNGTLTTPSVGPLAIHLGQALSQRDEEKPLSLAKLEKELINANREPSISKYMNPPYTVNATLRSDVGSVDFIPAQKRLMDKPQIWKATGNRPVSCCGPR